MTETPDKDVIKSSHEVSSDDLAIEFDYEVSPNEDAVKSDHEVSFDNNKTDPHAKYTHNRLHGWFVF